MNREEVLRAYRQMRLARSFEARVAELHHSNLGPYGVESFSAIINPRQP